MTTIPDGKGTGCLPRETNFGCGAFAPYGSDGTPPLFSKQQLRAMIPTHGNLLLEYHYRTIDQKSQSSCCGCAGVGALQLVDHIEDGGEPYLSQAVPYSFRSVNAEGVLIDRKRDDGMNIEECLQVLQLVGTCEINAVDPYDWNGRDGWPSDWKDSAARYRVAEAWDCEDTEAVMSALVFGYPVVFGTNNHAVIAIGYDEDGLIILNSWGADWGDNGIGRWPSHQIPHYGAWALRCTTADDAGPNEFTVSGGNESIRRRRRRFGRR